MKDADSQIIQLLRQILAAASGGAGAVWGAITGTLSNQADLQSALDAKVVSGAYGPDWNGDTTHAPARNDVYDKIESYSGGVIGTAWFTVAGGVIDTSFFNGVIGSVLKNGTGDYTISLVSAEADTNYITHVTVESDLAVSVQVPFATKLVGEFKILVLRASDNSAREASFVQLTVERLSQ